MGRIEARWVEGAAALSGGAAFVLLVAGFTLTDTGGKGASPGMSGEELAAIMAQHLPQWRTGAVLLLGAAVLQLLFAAVLWDRLRAGQAAQWPAALALGGGILGSVLITDAARVALVQLTAGQERDPTTSAVIVTGTWESAWAFIVPNLAVVTGAAVAGARGALPRWFTLFSAVTAVALVVALVFPQLPAGLLAVAAATWALPASAVLFWQVAKPVTKN